MGAKAIMLANPYTYKFLKGLTHSELLEVLFHSMEVKKVKGKLYTLGVTYSINRIR